MINSSLLAQTKKDLSQDFVQLSHLYKSQKEKVAQFLKKIEKQKAYIASFSQIKILAHHYLATYEKDIQIIKKIEKEISQIKTEKEINAICKKRNIFFDAYRTHISIASGLITASDWQSPSVEHSLYSNAGRQTNEIIVSYSDYKRDYHLDVRAYEQLFKKAYIDGVWKFHIPVYLTNSGMAAFTTILNFLEMERKITGPIVLGSSSYFQNKELINRLFTGVIEVHEHDTEKIQEIIENRHPSVLFFDSLCNSSDITVPNLPEIIETLKKTVTKDVYVVIDNTCLGASFQPLQLLGKFPKNIHMIVFESMNKYYQFGADKTIGGVIYASGKDTNNFFYTRQHSGTIMPDINCFQLPTPNKTILMQRLVRHQRNVLYIANELHAYINDDPNTPIEKIVYPTLSSHPANEWATRLSFTGSFFAFTWKKKYDTIKSYKRFIQLVLEQAKKQKVQLIMGTSFGLSTSRIYLTAPNAIYGKPFVRVSAGTETQAEIEKIKTVLLSAIKRL